VNTGIYMFAERFLDHIPVTTPSDLARDIFTLAPEVELYGYPLTGFRMSIDSPDEYHEANAAISEERCPRARGTAQNLRQ
jgi:NDP-sugar pyrophosphorylase family protein